MFNFASSPSLPQRTSRGLLGLEGAGHAAAVKREMRTIESPYRPVETVCRPRAGYWKKEASFCRAALHFVVAAGVLSFSFCFFFLVRCHLSLDSGPPTTTIASTAPMARLGSTAASGIPDVPQMPDNSPSAASGENTRPLPCHRAASLASGVLVSPGIRARIRRLPEAVLLLPALSPRRSMGDMYTILTWCRLLADELYWPRHQVDCVTFWMNKADGGGPESGDARCPRMYRFAWRETA